MRPINDRYKGRLTRQNIGAVAQVFQRMFGRRKRFTYTRVRPDYVKIAGVTPFIDTRVDCYTGVKLERTWRGGEKITPVQVLIEPNHSMLSISTTEYLCMYDTTLETQPGVGEYDYAFKNPYISFDGDRCAIKYQTPCGDQAVDMFVLEVR